MTSLRGLRSALCAIGILVASMTAAGAALAADSIVDAAIGFLEAQGYEIVEVERTWLGRVRVEAIRGRQERELVINPRTGEILRDYIEEAEDEDLHGGDGEEDKDDGYEASSNYGGGGSGNSGRGGGDDDDEDDDDDGSGGNSGSGGGNDDDDDDDDSGGGNSGSGGGDDDDDDDDDDDGGNSGSGGGDDD